MALYEFALLIIKKHLEVKTIKIELDNVAIINFYCFISCIAKSGCCLYNDVRILVIGKVGDAQSCTKRSSLFESTDSPVLKDDDGKAISPRPDISTNAYTEILKLFSGVGDWILFPKCSSGNFDNL